MPQKLIVTERTPWSSWFSPVIIPEAKLTDRLREKWGDKCKRGFYEANTIHPRKGLLLLNNAFPKLAALAGYKKDSKISRGWLTYKDNILRICPGRAMVRKCRAPPGTAFHGLDQHDPAGPEDLLFENEGRINSLHELFCAAEELLHTL